MGKFDPQKYYNFAKDIFNKEGYDPQKWNLTIPGKLYPSNGKDNVWFPPNNHKKDVRDMIEPVKIQKQ